MPESLDNPNGSPQDEDTSLSASTLRSEAPEREPLASPALRINVYIDGFNLYFGCLAGTPYRWLNIAALVDSLLAPVFPLYTVSHIRYFTAPVENRPNNPYARERQEVYFRALRTLPRLSLHFGKFKTNTRSYMLADGTGFAEVVRSEEKGSDVNLASYLLIDAIDGCYDVAVVISNDTDLVLPIQLARDRFGVAVGVAAPIYFRNRYPMVDLEEVADFKIHITRAHKAALRAAQFPEQIDLGDGSKIYRPPSWA
ncbi:MAG: NYN domain-containing protein [Dehalococcoidia bacterium]